MQVAIVLLLLTYLPSGVGRGKYTHSRCTCIQQEKKDEETLGPEEGEVKKRHSEENYTVKSVSIEVISSSYSQKLLKISLIM